ncbi:MAG: haloacid dehalogenase [Acidimicrobiales bacterium]
MSQRRDRFDAQVAEVTERLDLTNKARETALLSCRRVIRAAGSSIRAVHRHDPARAAALAAESEAELRQAQVALEPFPAIKHAGFLHDAEKEYVEARAVAALVGGGPVPGPDELGVAGPAWMRGLAEAASELRRYLLDRLRDGDLEQAEVLLGMMEDVYDALVVVDYPDALTGGLRRTVDALRAVLERSRGDVTTTVLQTRLQRALLGGDAATTPPAENR